MTVSQKPLCLSGPRLLAQEFALLGAGYLHLPISSLCNQIASGDGQHPLSLAITTESDQVTRYRSRRRQSVRDLNSILDRLTHPSRDKLPMPPAPSGAMIS